MVERIIHGRETYLARNKDGQVHVKLPHVLCLCVPQDRAKREDVYYETKKPSNSPAEA